MQNLQKLYSTLDVINYLGHICNDPKLLLNKKNRMSADDFIDRLHKIVYVAAENLAAQKDIDNITDITISMFLESYPDQQAFFIKNEGAKFVMDIKELSSDTSFEAAVDNIKKFTLLRNFEKNGFSTKFIYDVDLVDPELISERSKKFNELDISSIQRSIKGKLNNITQDFKTFDNMNCSFDAGEGIYELIDKCKESPVYGLSYQSKLYNAILRGMLNKKVVIRSGNTGSGKTRTMLGDMCNIAMSKLYDVDRGIWIENPNPVSATFISTELDKEELQLCLLAIVSGLEENKIKDGRFDGDLEARLVYAAKVIEESNVHIDYIEDFTMEEIEGIIENAVLKECAFIFFDYIQITANVANEFRRLFGYVLREDQMLNLMVTRLKNLANNYNLFIMTSTQLNRNYKTDGYLDATHLRGGTATPDKADIGIITVEATKYDLEKLDPIITAKFGVEIPTHAHHVYKNRGGKYKKVIIWTNTNLGNMRIKDCFVTTQDYEEIYIEPIIL